MSGAGEAPADAAVPTSPVPSSIAPPTLTPRPPKASRLVVALAATAAVLLVLIGAAAAMLFAERGEAPRVRPTPAAEPSKTQPPVERPLPVPVEQVTITIAVTPAEARILIDGTSAPANPYQVTLPTSGAEHQLVAEAEGYETVSRSVRFDESQRLELVLQRSVPAPHAGSTRGAEGHRGKTRPGKKRSDIYTVPPWE
jgi:hypothetical protein